MFRFLRSAVLSLIAILFPVHAIIIAVFLMVIADLLTGLVAAHRRGEKLTSAGLRRTITKILVYECAVILGFVAEVYLTGPGIPLSKWVSAFIGVTEFTSCLENLNEISGGNVFNRLIRRLGSVNARDMDE